MTSAEKKRTFKREKQRELELFLYNKFYTKFYKHKEKNPDHILGYFQNPDIKKQLLNYNGFLDDIDKIQIYNKILNSVYKDFKKYYTLEIDTTKEDTTQQKELEKAKKRYYKAVAKQNQLLKKHYQLEEENKKLKYKQNKIYQKGIDGAITTCIIGSIAAGKKHKNIFNKKRNK